MKDFKTKTIPKDAIWLSKFEFECLSKMTLKEFEEMNYGGCNLKFTSGGGRDVCKLIWRIIHGRNV